MREKITHTTSDSAPMIPLTFFFACSVISCNWTSYWWGEEEGLLLISAARPSVLVMTRRHPAPRYVWPPTARWSGRPGREGWIWRFLCGSHGRT